jgi:V8-like Glu-specific endopeptidase
MAACFKRAGAVRIAPVLAAAAVVALAASAVASPGTAAPRMAERSLDKSPARIRAYWTPQRMRAAEPAARPDGDERTAEPPGATASRRRSLHRRVRGTRQFPARTHGKVFFHLDPPAADPGNYACSATAVRSPSRALVVTAGHCVFDALGPGVFPSKWQFVPGYRGGRTPFGEWPAVSLATTGEWRIAGDTRYDVGFATVAKRGGRSLQDAIGAREIAFGRQRDQHYQAYGYPARPPPAAFDGGHLFRCDSPYAGADRIVPAPRPMRIRCDMTQGSSGGGWVAHGSKVVSVTSYGRAGQPGRLFGPYFGDVIEDLYDAVKRG